ncbi:MAG TPA: S1 family peptidase [Labilithrix sp.]
MRFLFVFLGAAIVGCAGGDPMREHLGAARQAVLEGGVDDTTHAVLVVEDPLMLCSGVLVAPDVLLTASHCVASAEPDGTTCADTHYPTGLNAAKTMQVYVGDSIDDPTVMRVTVAEVIPLAGEKTMCGNDIAALRLAKPIASITPLVPRLDAPPVVGEAVSVVGFGVDDPSDLNSSGTRRRRDDAKVSFVGARAKTGPAAELSAGDFAVSIGPCGGDSGSPALDAQGRVMGIMSRGDKSSCADMAYTRIDGHADWLRQLVRDAASKSGAEPPSWAALAPAADDAGPPDDAPAPPETTQTSSSSCAIGGPGDERSVLAPLAIALLFCARRRKR